MSESNTIVINTHPIKKIMLCLDGKEYEIDYFTRSMNNNADNIMVVCPNHHGIIHDRDPIFDKETKNNGEFQIM